MASKVPTFTTDDVQEEVKVRKGTRPVENIDITAAENGYTARVRYASKKSEGSDKNGSIPYEEPKTLVFADVNTLLEFLEGVLS